MDTTEHALNPKEIHIRVCCGSACEESSFAASDLHFERTGRSNVSGNGLHGSVTVIIIALNLFYGCAVNPLWIQGVFQAAESDGTSQWRQTRAL